MSWIKRGRNSRDCWTLAAQKEEIMEVLDFFKHGGHAAARPMRAGARVALQQTLGSHFAIREKQKLDGAFAAGRGVLDRPPGQAPE